MKHTLCLITGLFALSLLPLMAAEPSVFPKKNPVFSYEAPAKWKTEVDAKDGTTAINSPDGRISVNLAEVPVAASMEVFEKMLPDMIKDLDEPVVTQKPKEHTEDGLTGYAASYTAKIEGKPAMCMFALFKGDDKHSVLSCIVVGEPETLPEEDNQAMATFMKSWKGAAADGGEKAEADDNKEAPAAFPAKKPLVAFTAPEKWTSDIDDDNGSLSLTSKSERVSVNLVEVPLEASLETLEKMLPEVIKSLDEPVIGQKPAEHTEDGLTGYSATYTAKIDDKPAACNFVLFKGTKDRSVFVSFVVGEPESLPKEDEEALSGFMNSLKAAK